VMNKAASQKNMIGIYALFTGHQAEKSSNPWPQKALEAANAVQAAKVAAADDTAAAKVTMILFEYLASRNETPAKLFVSPADKTSSIELIPSARPKSDFNAATVTGEGWAADAVRPNISYAFDWSAGSSSENPKRVMIAERTTTFWGDDGVSVVYGDSHAGWLEADEDGSGGGGTNATEGSTQGRAVLNPDTKHQKGGNEPDNIYNGATDVANDTNPSRMVTRGQGSSTRAFVH